MLAVRVALLGLRGSGKSTVGRLLAEETGAAFFDLDAWTLSTLGVGSVRQFVKANGWCAFRTAECAALSQALAEPGPWVLSLGGGTPTAPGAAAALRLAADTGVRMVYLRCGVETLLERTAADAASVDSRPPLRASDAAEDIAQAFAFRDPLCASLVSRTVDASCVPSVVVSSVRAAVGL